MSEPPLRLKASGGTWWNYKAAGSGRERGKALWFKEGRGGGEGGRRQGDRVYDEGGRGRSQGDDYYQEKKGRGKMR